MITCISCNHKFVKSKKGGLMEMFSDMKYCLICVRYDFWFTESLRQKHIKIRKRKGVGYLTITKAGIDAVPDIGKISKKRWKLILDNMKNPKLVLLW